MYPIVLSADTQTHHPCFPPSSSCDTETGFNVLGSHLMGGEDEGLANNMNRLGMCVISRETENIQAAWEVRSLYSHDVHSTEEGKPHGLSVV